MYENKGLLTEVMCEMGKTCSQLGTKGLFGNQNQVVYTVEPAVRLELVLFLPLRCLEEE